MDAIIDEDETFGVEIEGIISGEGGEPSEPCYGDCCECTAECYGECSGDCTCEEERDNMREANTENNGELFAEYTEENINSFECDHCLNNCRCDFCVGECECDVCEGFRCGECECDVHQGYCSCTENNEGRNRDSLARFIREKTGIQIRSEGWNTTTKEYWKIIYDGSVSGEGEDCEVISPPIKGKQGLEDLKKVVNAMKDFGVVVNTSTGLHVHHDIKNISTDALGMLVQFYAFYEGIFDTFQPKSRRGQNAGLCQSVKRHFDADTAQDVFEKIKQRLRRTDSSCEKIGETHNQGIKDNNFDTLFYDEFHYRRYCKLNLQSYYKHGTVEFRHHSGTVDAEKICNWVELTQALLKYCQKKKSRITGKHKPTFKKLMELTEVREEVFTYYDSRRKHFAEKYGKIDYQCTDHERGYK